MDGAEAVVVDYDPLPAVTDPAAALAPGAPEVWPGLAPGNLAFRYTLGDEAAVAAAFARAARVVSLDLRLSRITANPMEPRAAIAEWDAGAERFLLRSGLQNPHAVRDELASRVFSLPIGSVRVISPDMGGAFGMRGQPTQEACGADVRCPRSWPARALDSHAHGSAAIRPACARPDNAG